MLIGHVGFNHAMRLLTYIPNVMVVEPYIGDLHPVARSKDSWALITSIKATTYVGL